VPRLTTVVVRDGTQNVGGRDGAQIADVRRPDYGRRMADQPPTWRQGFDAVERQLAPRIEALVQSEQFAVAVGLAARVQRTVEDRMSRATRRNLHRMNLPAGTDVARILHEIGQLRVQVRELSAELEEARAELAGAKPASVVRATPVKRRARKAPARKAS
jgi:hypothetical protein